MADKSITQTIKDAEIDARSLSEFISKDASFTVTRRLAPTIHTLDYYLSVLSDVKEKGDLADIAISDTLEELDRLEPTVIQRVENAINSTAIEGGVLADTFLTLTSQEGSTPRNLRDKLASLLDAKDFGAVGDGVTDDTEAINRYIAYCKTKTPCRFLLPTGKYLVSETITLDLPDSASIIFEGNLISSVEHKDLLVIGSETVNHFNYSLTNISAEHTDGFSNISTDTTKTCAAVRLLNIVSATGNISRAKGCWHGVVADASAGNGGFSYNQISLGSLKDSVVCVRLMARAPSGYTNENTFFGGSMGHSSSFPYTGEEVGIIIDQSSGVFNLNNNLFFRPSLESNGVASKAAEIGGSYNTVYMPRIEDSKNYQGFTIELMPSSSNCRVVGGGFGLNNSTMLDNGNVSKYENNATMFFSGVPSGDRGVLELQNAASNTGLAITSKNTSKTVTFRVFANGDVVSSTIGYFGAGVRWRTNKSGRFDDRGIFIGSEPPEGVQEAYQGSMYFNTQKGNTYIKQAGGTLGWKELEVINPVTTIKRPTTPAIGQSVFDTTLAKPVWWNGTAWVDATGVIA